MTSGTTSVMVTNWLLSIPDVPSPTRSLSVGLTTVFVSLLRKQEETHTPQDGGEHP